MIFMSIQTWSEYKTTVITNKGLSIQYNENTSGYEIYAAETMFIWNIFLLKDGGSDVTDFEANYKSQANKSIVLNSSIQSQPPFGSKILTINGATKKLYSRNTGLQFTVNNGVNTLTYTAAYTWVKLIGAEVINCTALDTIDFKVYDTAAGTYSGVPNALLNQFGFSVNLPNGYYTRTAPYDADVYVGMVLQLTYTSVDTLSKTIGVNLIMNEVK